MKKSIPSLSPLWAILLLFIILIALSYTLINKAPPVWYLKSLTVKQDSILGYKELGQSAGNRSADKQHLQVRHQGNKWWLANVSPQKKVWAKPHQGKGFYLKRWQLQTGDIVQIKQLKIHVQADKQQLKLTIPKLKNTATWQGNGLQATETNYANCPAENYKANAKRLLGMQKTLFTLGGKVQCVDRWKLPDIPLATARIEYADNHYWLYPQRHDVFFSFQRGKTVKAINALETDASALKSLIIGRTAYTLDASDTQLTLTPIKRLILFPQKPEQLSGQYWAQATWSGAIASIDITPADLGKVFYIITSLFFMFALWMARLNRIWWYHLHQDYSSWKTITALVIPLIAFIIGWGIVGEHLGYLILLVAISWVWLTLLLYRHQWLEGIAGWLWFLLLFLAGFGLITLTQLAAGAGNTYWISFPQRYLSFLLAISILLSTIAITPPKIWEQIWLILVSGKGFIKLIYSATLLILVGLLGFQMLKGTESGLGFLQPVELVKLLLVLLLAKLTLDMNEARQLIRLSSTPQILKRFGRALLLALVFFVVVVASVRDFSPILIVFGLALAYIWIILRHPINPRLKSLWGGRLALLAIIASIVLLGWFLHNYPTLAATLHIPQAERFMIWSNPFNYPDTGRQLQLSLQYTHDGGWTGSGWFGSNGKAMNLPAVQDDFILAFTLYKYGGIAVISLLIAQLAWVGLIFTLLQQLLVKLPQARDERLAQALLAYILYGLAWMQLLHWLISWGNVLGLLPIMGQPMTWLSSGNSHLLAIALPSVLLALLASRRYEK